MPVQVEMGDERLALGLDQIRRVLEERHADLVRAGLHGDADLEIVVHAVVALAVGRRGDGEQRDVIEGKAVSATTTTCNTFRLLAAHGVPTHFVDQVDPVTFRARRVEMIPLELVARRIATGSFLDRHPDVAEGTVLADLVFEVFEKDDASHDPLLAFDPIYNSVPAGARERLQASFDMDATKPEWALAYNFDIVLRGRNATPME